MAMVQAGADGLRIKLDYPDTDEFVAKLQAASIGNVGAVAGDHVERHNQDLPRRVRKTAAIGPRASPGAVEW